MRWRKYKGRKIRDQGARVGGKGGAILLAIVLSVILPTLSRSLLDLCECTAARVAILHQYVSSHKQISEHTARFHSSPPQAPQ